MSAERPVAGIILAAGLGSRLGGAKLLLPWNDRPLVRHIAEVACASRLDDTVVVTGHRSVEVTAALADLPLRTVYNPDYQAGLSSSLRAGVAAVSERAGAALVMLADQPLLTSAIVDRLLEAYRLTRAPIVAPVAGGRRGNPVLFDRALFPELMALRGDRGARPVVEAHMDQLYAVEVDAAVLEDIDTREAYEAIRTTTAGR